MVARSYLRAGAYPPDGEDFVLVSIAGNGDVRVTAREGATGFRSELFGAAQHALEQGVHVADGWARAMRLTLIYVEVAEGISPEGGCRN